MNVLWCKSCDFHIRKCAAACFLMGKVTWSATSHSTAVTALISLLTPSLCPLLPCCFFYLHLLWSILSLSDILCAHLVCCLSTILAISGLAWGVIHRTSWTLYVWKAISAYLLSSFPTIILLLSTGYSHTVTTQSESIQLSKVDADASLCVTDITCTQCILSYSLWNIVPIGEWTHLSSHSSFIHTFNLSDLCMNLSILFTCLCSNFVWDSNASKSIVCLWCSLLKLIIFNLLLPCSVWTLQRQALRCQRERVVKRNCRSTDRWAGFDSQRETVIPALSCWPKEVYMLCCWVSLTGRCQILLVDVAARYRCLCCWQGTQLPLTDVYADYRLRHIDYNEW